MSYNYLLFRPQNEPIDFKHLDESSMLPIGTNEELRLMLSNLYDIEWCGIGEDFCWGNWFGVNEGAEFKLYGGDVVATSFCISSNLNLVKNVAEKLHLCVYDPQAFEFFRPNGKQEKI